MNAGTSTASSYSLSSPGLATWTALYAAGGTTPSVDDAHVLGHGQDVSLLAISPGAAQPATAANERYVVLFDGLLYNRESLVERLPDDRHAAPRNDAEIILELFAQRGEAFLTHIRGVFAVVVFDSHKDCLWAARDPLGVYPLYYAQRGRDLIFSTSIDSILAQPEVSRSVNLSALADYLCQLWPRAEETYFESIFRVPQGHVLKHSASGSDCRRYWDPLPAGQAVNWVTEEEIDQFGPLFTRAVERCMGHGRTGIFLSGGLDSVSVAAAAAEIAGEQQLPVPLALSLVFPHPECDEEDTQRSVAQQLKLPQELLAFEEAAGAEGLLKAALEMNATLPAPIINTWFPAYVNLAAAGRDHGCQTIVTGGGGDEWLSVHPAYAADLIRRGNLVGLVRLMSNYYRSHHHELLPLSKTVLWRFGLRTLAAHAARSTMMFVAPQLYTARRRRTWQAVIPDWVAPRTDLRRAMQARYLAQDPPMAPHGFYFDGVRSCVDHSLVSLEFEETHAVSRQIGVRVLQPFWDADLAEFLYRVPPRLLNRSGRHKSLLREFLRQRFSQLEFERQKKVSATAFYRSILQKELASIYRSSMTPTALADVGIIDRTKTDRLMQDVGSACETGDMVKMWLILNLEAWLRTRI